MRTRPTSIIRSICAAIGFRRWSATACQNRSVPAPFRACKDVINLRRNDRVKPGVPLRDFTGLAVYHCHIVKHEDRGMMGTLEVRR